jgi:hypothetical protein
MLVEILTIFLIGIPILLAISDTKKQEKNEILNKENEINDSDIKPITKRTNRKKKALLLILLVLFSLNLSVRLFHFNKKINGHAEWKNSNGQPYLSIDADDHYSLGYLTGYHLWREILNAKIATGLYIKNEYLPLVSEYESFIPQEYIDEMRGIAEGVSSRSGIIITYRDILLQNSFLDILYGHMNPDKLQDISPLACTSIASKNTDGSIVAGQNFDFITILGQDGLLSSIAFVEHHVKGKQSVFSLRLGGILALPMAKNSAGIYSFVNVLNSNIKTNVKIPEMIKFRIALEDASNLNDFHNIIFAENPNFILNLILTDGNSVITVQNNITSTRYNSSSLIVQANRFEYEDWNLAHMINPSFSEGRLNNAKRLASNAIEEDKVLSEDELIEILSNKEEFYGEGSAVVQSGKEISTIAFMTLNYFGLGLIEGEKGLIPI